MGAAQNFVFDGPLAPLIREAGHGHGNAPIKVAKWPDRPFDSLVEDD